MEERLFFKLKINIENLDEYFQHGDPFTGECQAELEFEDETYYQPVLKIYFKDTEYLGDKLMRWNHESESNLLDHFEFAEAISPDGLLDVDFKGYDIMSMSNSSKSYEFNLKFTTIRLNGVKKVYKADEKGPSIFYLNPPAFNLVELHYNYNTNFSWSDEPFKLEPENSVNEFLPFNKVSFRPEHKFLNLTKNDSQQIEIKKKPLLKFNESDLSEPEIKKHADLLCSLYSFYSQTRIDYFLSRIVADGKLYIDVRKFKSEDRKDPHGIFRWDFSQNPLKLIINVNPVHLLDNLDFVTNLVSRYNFALSTGGESKFMILYNILEQIRNRYILDQKIEQEKAGSPPNLNRVKEEYTFTTSNTATDKKIKEVLQQITEFVADEHKELFKEEIKYKLTPIKVFSMANQFKSLFEHINIDPESFKIDFKKVKKLRDDIFHGKPVQDHMEDLKELNRYKRLPRLVGVVMLKYFGIDDLAEIKKSK